jgi:hypothetical protein
MAFELRNPAVVLPKFNVVTVDYLPGAFPCGGVVIADQIDGFHELAVTADKISSIVRHIRGLPSHRLEFAIKPTAHTGFHGVARYDRRVNATALPALEGAVIKPDGPASIFERRNRGS